MAEQSKHSKIGSYFENVLKVKNDKYLERNNLNKEPYYGIISPDEGPSGPYSDLSLCVFLGRKNDNEETDQLFVTLVVGTEGFKNDFDLAMRPGTRRVFMRLVGKEGILKTDFTNLSSGSNLRAFRKNLNEELSNTIKKYNNSILAGQLIDIKIDDLDDFIDYIISNKDDNSHYEIAANIIRGYFCAYAKIREWCFTTDSNVEDAIKKAEEAIKIHNNTIEEEENNKAKKKENKEDQKAKEAIKAKNENVYNEISNLLLKRKFLILQGAPGTSKTHVAKMIPKKIKEIEESEKKERKEFKVFFTQFHAETSYSDFVYGIFPKLHNENESNANETFGEALEYEDKNGILVEAIEYAEHNENYNVYLIIDEINRANLSNVLGEAFYLFERDMSKSEGCKITLGKKSYPKLPENLYVIGTMNTADRSLAVIDFALRRRFAWYTMKPTEIVPDDEKKHFHIDCFNAFKNLFEKYATDEELNLQPGQGYFITDSENNKELMKQRLKYELMPLIKEYFNEGIMLSAQDEFVKFFRDEIGEEMYQ